MMTTMIVGPPEFSSGGPDGTFFLAQLLLTCTIPIPLRATGNPTDKKERKEGPKPCQ